MVDHIRTVGDVVREVKAVLAESDPLVIGGVAINEQIRVKFGGEVYLTYSCFTDGTHAHSALFAARLVQDENVKSKASTVAFVADVRKYAAGFFAQECACVGVKIVTSEEQLRLECQRGVMPVAKRPSLEAASLFVESLGV